MTRFVSAGRPIASMPLQLHVVCMLVCVAQLVGCSPSSKDTEPAKKSCSLAVEHPQVDFGTTVSGRRVSHRFLIRNTSDSLVAVGNYRDIPSRYSYKTECEFSAREIQPGQQIEVTLTIVPNEPSPQTYAGVYLESGDGGEVRIGGKIKVESPLTLQPNEVGGDVWKFEIGENGEPRPFEGIVHSAIPEPLQFAKVNSSNPSIQATLKPLAAENLKTLKTSSGEKIQAYSGAAIRVQADGLTTVGPFSSELTFSTTGRPRYEITRRIVGTRRGPLLRVFADGARWNPQAALLNLGRIQAATGKTIRLRMVLAAPDAGAPAMLWQRVDSDSKTLLARIEADARQSTESRKWAHLILTVPAGKPPTVRSRLNPIHIRIFTNHPRAKEIHFRVYLTSS